MSNNDPHDNGLVVIRSYVDPHAGTGEGRIFVTADGKHWREQLCIIQPVPTNTVVGYLRNGRIERI